MEDNFNMLPSAVIFIDNKLHYNEQCCRRIPQTIIKLYSKRTYSLDLSYNELINIQEAAEFVNLEELILDNNYLNDNIFIPYLPKLHTLSLNNNHISDIKLLIPKIKENLPNLTYLSLLGNIACPHELISKENNEKDYQRYRYYVLYHLPGLKFLDANKVRDVERREAARCGQFMNVIRPKESNGVSFINISDTSFNPLPKNLRCANDFKGVYGKCPYRYSGKHSEGNRFISNKDL